MFLLSHYNIRNNNNASRFPTTIRAAKQKIQEGSQKSAKELPRVSTRGCLGLSKYMFFTDVIDI